MGHWNLRYIFYIQWRCYETPDLTLENLSSASALYAVFADMAIYSSSDVLDNSYLAGQLASAIGSSRVDKIESAFRLDDYDSIYRQLVLGNVGGPELLDNANPTQQIYIRLLLPLLLLL